MLMHNGQLVDPLNKYTVAIKEIVSKGCRKMTEADHLQRDRLEWEGSLYWSKEHGPVIPSDNIERCIQLGAQKSRLGKDVSAAVFCQEPEVPLQYKGPRELNQLMNDPRFMLRKAIVVGNHQRIMRIRPMFPTGWNITFSLEFDDTIISEKNLVKAMVDAGALIGLSDWRPKFGRFTVDVES